MPLTTEGQNQAISAIAPDQMSLHTGDPSDNGSANEANGGGYSRQACSFGAASGGSKSLSATVTFSVAGNATPIDYTHYALWEGATCVDKGTLASTKSMTENGNIDVTTGSISIT